jgi:cell division GTPase FtsZ
MEIFVFLAIAVVIIYFINKNKTTQAQQKNQTIDHKYNAEKNMRQQEVDRILDKISKRGMNSLSASEKAILKDYSDKI